MEDLFDVQARHMNRIFEVEANPTMDDLISRAVYEINIATHAIITSFQAARFGDKPLKPETLKSLLFIAIEWTMTLFYLYDLDAPEIDEVQTMASTYLNISLAADGILAALHAQRALADVALDHFCDDASMSIDEIDHSLGEILGCLELIAKRLNTSTEGLIQDH